MKKELRFYRTLLGKEPFTSWFKTLRDQRIRSQIKNRLERVAVGNYGDYKSVGEGVLELRIHYGGGYRIYFAEYDSTIVLILIGGGKNSQRKDIEQAKKYWSDFQEQIRL